MAVSVWGAEGKVGVGVGGVYAYIIYVRTGKRSHIVRTLRFA